MVAVSELPSHVARGKNASGDAANICSTMELARADYDEVTALFGTGLSDREIARRTGVSQSTVSRWHRAGEPPLGIRRDARGREWSVHDGPAYAYLLGAYLGDGTVCHQPPGFWSLQIVNDRRYPEISTEVLHAMTMTFSGATARLRPSWAGESDVLHISHPAIQRAFPQHGPGRKHTRPIELADWQRELTHAHPGALIRGLIHSDGCRCLNHVKTTLPSGRVAEYHYVRYFFTNHSADIRAIFAEHCELLGIRVTRPNHRNLAVSHRASVAILEEIVGPKH